MSYLKQAQQILQSDLDPDTKFQLAAVALQALDWRCKHLTERLRRLTTVLSTSFGFNKSLSSSSFSPHSSKVVNISATSSPATQVNKSPLLSNGAEHPIWCDSSGYSIFVARLTYYLPPVPICTDNCAELRFYSQAQQHPQRYSHRTVLSKSFYLIIDLTFSAAVAQHRR
jgi:hypothetical protein